LRPVRVSAIAEIVVSIEPAAGGRASLPVEVTGGVTEELVPQVGSRRETDQRARVKHARIELAISDEHAIGIALQPICELKNRATVGVEALARFQHLPRRSPDQWFAEATETGLRTTLELVTVQQALSRLGDVPPDAYLSINVSPASTMTTRFRQLLEESTPERLVMEITEHIPIDDYTKLKSSLEDLRGLGVRLAIDDAGAGFASFRHILQLAPDFIKLDLSLISGIEADASKRALAAGLIAFAQVIGSTIVAEGIERQEELAELETLGVQYGQGYLLGRPVE
jgi:EAL domain-containing protein (putative c-di-GMP-specific phosphodiesterase class I)